jgi:hypothetical protein
MDDAAPDHRRRSLVRADRWQRKRETGNRSATVHGHEFKIDGATTRIKK